MLLAARSSPNQRLPQINPYASPSRIAYQRTFPVKQKLNPLNPIQDNQPKNKHEIFQAMLVSLRTDPIHLAIERAFSTLLDTKNCLLWICNQKADALVSPTLGKSIGVSTGIVGDTFQTKKLQNLMKPIEHPRYCRAIDHGKCPSMYIPLITKNDKIFGIVQVYRLSSSVPFSFNNEEEVKFFMQSFTQLSHLILRHQSIPISIEINEVIETFDQVKEKLRNMFKCRDVQFWVHDLSSDEVSQIIKNETVKSEHEGPIEQIIRNQMSKTYIRSPPSNLPTESNEFTETLLSSMIENKQQKLFIILLGKQTRRTFSNTDSLRLSHISPLILSALTHSKSSGESRDFALRLKALLEVAEMISERLDIDTLIPTIMDRACSLMHTERCSLFLLDNSKQSLVTNFHGGLDRSITIPINMGVAGATATTGSIININDAYSDPRFSNKVDLETGFTTKTILSVPIYNNRGDITGVTEMINRIDGSAFDEEDIRMMMAFNVFCGISLDNAKLYTTSLNLTRQLRVFAQMGTAITNSKTIQNMLTEVLNNAMSVIQAARATIYSRDLDTDTITVLQNVGENVDNGIEYAEEVIKLQRPKIFGRQQNILKVDESRPTLSRVSSVLSFDSNDGSMVPKNSSNTNSNEPNICCFPLMTNDQKIIGAMELKCNWVFLSEDMKLLDCFAIFAAILLEKSQLEDIAKYGQIETTMKKWISKEERNTYEIPNNLKIPDERKPIIFTIQFDASQWDGIGLFKVLWAIMDSYNLFEEFDITNETFYHFVYEISNTYNKVPYHNWRHAVDVTQFVTYQVKTAGLDKTLTKFDLLGLTIASICHDANHEGFTNIFNEKAETPLGILFKNQSVMETHHCTVSIRIISKEECNIFHKLTPEEYKKMWTLIIQLILYTDMSKHFELLKIIGAELDKGPLDINNNEHKLMIMKIILKCADISNVSRPFELADKWCDVLCEEFFRQGDLEIESGMELTSPLNDREHSDKPKSQINFYNFVCLPLFRIAVRAMPKLDVNVKQIESNLAIWQKESQQEAQNKQENQ
ncbi:3'5'-cyclic nucleotide phosphodiesterase family protein [Histomonas meleagridis]|uniref:3'5'-cyclic nucleotide phosphodiesterase family protein n=1 Tax=Histomonas meleagridis TaxID=135588 RepID=UPI003559DD5B|nr:3'5'-cyclic nucleotide phosphodiesterase family protein [Histomonas meleagridis]KAH0806490.1 3'5'-cyclic nucleotide phosphodiesterase family protein [Histomonas meleagridis]